MNELAVKNKGASVLVKYMTTPVNAKNEIAPEFPAALDKLVIKPYTVVKYLGHSHYKIPKGMFNSSGGTEGFDEG